MDPVSCRELCLPLCGTVCVVSRTLEFAALSFSLSTLSPTLHSLFADPFERTVSVSYKSGMREEIGPRHIDEVFIYSTRHWNLKSSSWHVDY